jgi:hypothetical protein
MGANRLPTRQKLKEMPCMQNVNVTRKGTGGSIPPRIYMLFARESPVAVVFRRGPSEWYQLVKWNTANDSFEPGQWFHGRLYERRSDLSPDGALLLYFARKITGRTLKDTEYTYAWTAISKPPYLTALALWPKGDCWHGGGLFLDNTHVELNHKSEVKNPHPDHKPLGVHVVLRKNVHGEDEPLYAERLERDGWKLRTKWDAENLGYPEMFRTRQPEIREKSSPDGSLLIRLTRSMQGLDYSEVFTLISAEGDLLLPLAEASWVDWDQQGRLVLARRGKIVACALSDNRTITERVLADLTSEMPQELESPVSAKTWEPERPPLSAWARVVG